jgi:DNA gyrase subunit A
MFFTRDGRCYWLKVYEIPQGARASRGKPIVNLINLPASDGIAALVPVREFSPDRYLVFATRKGVVKKTVLSAYGNPRVTGINAINVTDGDVLIDVQLTDGLSDVVLATREGMAIRFAETDVRDMGRATTGVRGISLSPTDVVVGMVVMKEGATLLVIAENGIGKRTDLDAYRKQRRGGKGVINIKTSPKTGKVISIKRVVPGNELMVITKAGVVNRQSVDGIRVIGRNTQGVRLINLDAKDSVVDVACVVADDALPTEEGEVAPVLASAELPETEGSEELEDAGDEEI